MWGGIGLECLCYSLLMTPFFFSKASMEHLQNLKIILLVFRQVSGLKINLKKNTISGINTRQELLSSLASVLDCRVSRVAFVLFRPSIGREPKDNRLLGSDG